MPDESEADDLRREARVRRTTAIIWEIGILIAALIFISNGKARDNSGEYRAQDSKVYVREAEKFGGKAVLMGQDLNETFVSLWHGRRLAFTTLALTALVSFSYRIVAR